MNYSILCVNLLVPAMETGNGCPRCDGFCRDQAATLPTHTSESENVWDRSMISFAQPLPRGFPLGILYIP